MISSFNATASPVENDLRWGVFVVFEAPNDYAAACFKAIRPADRSKRALCGNVQAVSSDRYWNCRSRSASVALRGEPTGKLP